MSAHNITAALFGLAFGINYLVVVVALEPHWWLSHPCQSYSIWFSLHILYSVIWILDYGATTNHTGQLSGNHWSALLQIISISPLLFLCVADGLEPLCMALSSIHNIRDLISLHMLWMCYTNLAGPNFRKVWVKCGCLVTNHTINVVFEAWEPHWLAIISMVIICNNVL